MNVRARVAPLAMIAALSASLTAACAGLLGLDDETALQDAGVHDGRSPDVYRPRLDAGVDATETGAGRDAGIDALEDATTASHDAGQEAGEGDVRTSADGGAPCAAKTTDDSRGVYVVSGGASSACGPRANPCGDLGAALAASIASFKNGVVYVGPGTFVSSTEVLPEGISVVGGWSVANGTWTGSCDPNATPVVVQTSAPAVFTIGSPSAPSASTITLDTLHLVNAATPTAGESLYGILAVGSSTSSLVLNDVTIAVPAAGTGPTGDTGGPGATTTQTGCGPADSGVDGGGPGARAEAGVGPTFSAAGCVPAPVGPAASTGMAGASPPPVTRCAMEPTTCVDVSGTCEFGPATSVCATAQSGCGGGGGGGGKTGGGGGCSVGLYLWGESAQINRGSVTAGNGGAGGLGGAGGPGAVGAARGNGTALYAVNCLPIGNCILEQGVFAIDAAADVGQGGRGGTGGQGGGGRGGDSYAVYAGGGAVVTASDASALSPGEAGVGGQPNGVNGVAAPRN